MLHARVRRTAHEFATDEALRKSVALRNAAEGRPILVALVVLGVL